MREQFARNQAAEFFEESVEKALLTLTDFCYETNFDTHPTYWAQKFKEKGYQVNLIFFCLKEQKIARHRVQVRTEFKGHLLITKLLI